MKTKFTFIVTCLVLHLTTMHAQWESTALGPFNVAELTSIGDELHTYGLLSDYSSTNNGDTWIKDTLLGMGATPYVTAFTKSTDTYFSGDPYGHIYASNDGTNWTLNYDFGMVASIPYMVADGNNIYAAIDGLGVLYSNDNGASWTLGDGGLAGNNHYISQIIIVGSDLYMSTLGGVLKSTDGGANWVTKNVGLPDLMQCNGIAISQGALLTSGYGVGVFRSTDLGESWTQITSGFDGFLFVGGFYTNGDIAVVGGSLCKAHFSTDGGQTWSLIAQGAGGGFDVFNGFLIENGYLFGATTTWVIRVALEDLGIEEVGIQNEINGELKIYPNPTANILHFESSNTLNFQNMSIQITDINGKIATQYTNSINKIDVSNLPNGIYFLTAFSGDIQLHQQFIIAK